EAPHRALPHLAVAVGVLQGMVELLLRPAVRLGLEPPVALRLGEGLAALLARVDGTLDARHSSDPQLLPSVLDVARRERRVPAKAPLPLRRLLLQHVTLHRPATQELPAGRHLEPFLRSAVCLLFRHLCLLTGAALLRSCSDPAPSPCCGRPGGAAARRRRSPSRPPPGASAGRGRAPDGSARAPGT